jgi:predicted HTH domain antitoxin
MSAITANQMTVELPIDVTPEEAQLAMAVRLYQKGRVSLGRAAMIAGFSKRAFMDVLRREGVAICNYTAQELAEEIGE